MATSNEQPKAAADRSAAEQQKSTSGGARQTRGQQADVRGDLAQEARESYERRTTVPGVEGVDARLDNRVGADRPPVEQWPAKPQQIDGPDLMHQAEHTRRTLQDRDRKVGDRKGMFSPGPHGLSDKSLREGGERGEEKTLYGTEGLTEDEVAEGSTKAN